VLLLVEVSEAELLPVAEPVLVAVAVALAVIVAVALPSEAQENCVHQTRQIKCSAETTHVAVSVCVCDEVLDAVSVLVCDDVEEGVIELDDVDDAEDDCVEERELVIVAEGVDLSCEDVTAEVYADYYEQRHTAPRTSVFGCWSLWPWESLSESVKQKTWMSRMPWRYAWTRPWTTALSCTGM
jgi:hypothetical protein